MGRVFTNSRVRVERPASVAPPRVIRLRRPFWALAAPPSGAIEFLDIRGRIPTASYRLSSLKVPRLNFGRNKWNGMVNAPAS